ncbi:hypothetical protein BC828DRAFT_402745 [Blastocladiella britannica]|nr:hypothetical protein BC828DRAFT_402745 [Blastocladiella britannica]
MTAPIALSPIRSPASSTTTAIGDVDHVAISHGGGGLLVPGHDEKSGHSQKKMIAIPGNVDPAVHAQVLKAQKLLLRLTKALFAYGAPLYRVELRVQAAADGLGIPLSILSLPNAVVLAFGDGSPAIWPQTYIVKGLQGQNMGKLQEVDKWARKLVLQCEVAKEAHRLQHASPSSPHPDASSSASNALTGGASSVAAVSPRSTAAMADASKFEIGDGDDEDAENAHDDNAGLLGDASEKQPITKKQPLAVATAGLPRPTGGSRVPRDGGTFASVEALTEPLNGRPIGLRQQRKGAVALSPSGFIMVSPLSSTLPGQPAETPTSATSDGTAFFDPSQILTLNDGEIEWFLRELERVADTSGELPPWIRILATGFTAMLMVLMLSSATWQDLVLTLVLGTLNGVLSHFGELYRINALEVLVPMTLAIVGKVVELGVGSDLCFGSVTMFACFNYFPGTLMTLSMVELAARNLVSGTVRMFYSFVRSVKLGFGLAMGARMVTWINAQGFPGVDLSKDTEQLRCMDSATRPNTVRVQSDLGLMFLVFIPMSLCINIVLRGRPSQWLGMFLTSATALFTLRIASLVFTKDASAALAAFMIGIVSHLYARYKDDLAIANIMAGIFWLTPGVIGVKGSAMLMTDDLNGSTSFALDMILRAISLSIGLYLSSLMLFPMARKSKMASMTL